MRGYGPWVRCDIQAGDSIGVGPRNRCVVWNFMSLPRPDSVVLGAGAYESTNSQTAATVAQMDKRRQQWNEKVCLEADDPQAKFSVTDYSVLFVPVLLSLA